MALMVIQNGFGKVGKNTPTMETTIQRTTAIRIAFNQPVLYNHFNAINQIIPPIAAAIMPFPKKKAITPNIIEPKKAAKRAIFRPSFSPSNLVTR